MNTESLQKWIMNYILIHYETYESVIVMIASNRNDKVEYMLDNEQLVYKWYTYKRVITG